MWVLSIHNLLHYFGWVQYTKYERLLVFKELAADEQHVEPLW